MVCASGGVGGGGNLVCAPRRRRRRAGPSPSTPTVTLRACAAATCLAWTLRLCIGPLPVGAERQRCGY
eukprot:1196127-Rhodomonas_salina.2